MQRMIREQIKAFCTSPFPVIMKADNKANETNNILIGTSKIEVTKLKAVARLSIKNFKENCNPNKTNGNKNLKGTLVKKSIFALNLVRWSE